MSDVVCLCWNGGREILTDESQHFIDEEIWCDDCAEGMSDDETESL